MFALDLPGDRHTLSVLMTVFGEIKLRPTLFPQEIGLANFIQYVTNQLHTLNLRNFL